MGCCIWFDKHHLAEMELIYSSIIVHDGETDTLFVSPIFYDISYIQFQLKVGCGDLLNNAISAFFAAATQV